MPTLTVESSKVLSDHIPQLVPYRGSWFYIFGQGQHDSRNDVGLTVYQYLGILLLAYHYQLFQARKKVLSSSVKDVQWRIKP